MDSIPRLFLDDPHPVFVIDTDGVVVDINAAVPSEYGWTVSAVADRPLASLVPDDGVDQWNDAFHRCLAGEEIRGFRTRRLMRSGAAAPVEIDMSRTIATDEQHVRVIVRDKSAEPGNAVDDSWVLDSSTSGTLTPSTMLRESESRAEQRLAELEQLYATAPIGLALVDRDLRFIRVNSTLADVNGVPVDDHIGRTVHEVIPQVAETVTPFYRSVFESGEPLVDIDIQGETASQPGVLRDWVLSCHPLINDSGEVFAVNASVREVTASRRAEQQLRQSENQLRMVLDGTTDGFWDFDLTTAQTVWSDASNVLAATSGNDQSWLTCLSSMVHPRDRHRFEQVVQDHLDLETALDGEFRFRQHDGEWIWLRCRGKAIRDDDGQPVRLIGINIDISESKLLEQLLLRQAESERVQLSRELHDSFGQEISGIAMMLANLRQGISPGSEIQGQLARLEHHVETAKRQVRSVARGLFPVDVDAAGLTAALRQLVEETDTIHEISCQFECSQVVSIEDNLVATQLFLIAREALHNAVKHSAAERIVVRLANHDGITVEVEDDGAGVTPDVSAYSGLGIRIMRHRASRIGAALSVRTKPAGGLLVSCRHYSESHD